MKEPLSSTKAATYLGISLGTVLRWSNDGFLPHYRMRGKQRRYYPEVLDVLKQCWREGITDIDEQKRRMYAKQEELANGTQDASAGVR